MATQQPKQSNWRRGKTQGGTIVNSTFTCYTYGKQGHASTNYPWKDKIQEMVRKKTQDHKSMGGGIVKKIMRRLPSTW